MKTLLISILLTFTNQLAASECTILYDNTAKQFTIKLLKNAINISPIMVRNHRGSTFIESDSLACMVHGVLVQATSEGLEVLKEKDIDYFTCGTSINAEGDMEACSDPEMN